MLSSPHPTLTLIKAYSFVLLIFFENAMGIYTSLASCPVTSIFRASSTPIFHKVGKGNICSNKYGKLSLRFQSVSSEAESVPGYYTLSSTFEYEEIVKKSRFIARASPVTTWEEAKDFIEAVSEAKASHNCWAFVPGSDPSSYRFSDDGEPGGTAGKPILNAIQAEELRDVVVCVTRYFGGTKLGTGGLIRAYGGSARNCLILADRCFKESTIGIEIEVPMESIGGVYQVLSDHKRLAEEYTPTSLVLSVLVFEKDLNSLTQQIQDASRGAALIRRK